MPNLNQNRVIFLAKAGKILSSTLDYNVTLVSVAKLLVESVADFCIIDILENKEMKRVVVRTAKRSEQHLANRMFDFRPDPRNKKAIYDAASLGSPILIKKVTTSWLKTVSQIEEEREIVRKLQLESFIFAPLISRGKVIGVITVGSNNQNPSYTDEDVIFLNALAGRAGLAVDNSKLFSEAQAALHARDEFLSIASHELKTPLTSILLALQYAIRHLKNGAGSSLDPKIVTALETGVTQTRRLSALMTDLLNISVISTGKLIIDKEDSDLIQILNDALSGFDLQALNKKIKITFKNKNDVLYGMWDKIRMGEVFTNLISNAIKYGKGSPIIIEAFGDIDKVTVTIKDKGIGISQEEQDIIFELFRRTKLAADFKGMGVGLYISNQIVTAHGGKITVDSSPEKGTTFIIDLPR